MALPSGSGAIGPVTPQHMIGVQCPELQNSTQANAAASWRYINFKEKVENGSKYSLRYKAQNLKLCVPKHFQKLFCYCMCLVNQSV